MMRKAATASMLLVACTIFMSCGSSEVRHTAQVTEIAPTFAPQTAAVLVPTSTLAAPTPPPIQVTPTLPPDARILRFVSKEGEIALADGSPLVIAAFTPDGGSPAGMIAADLRNTQFDFTSIDKQSKSGWIAIAVQIASREIQHTVMIEFSDLDTFYISEGYVVFPFPPSVSAVEEGGPFIRLVFLKQGTGKKPEPLSGWAVTCKQGERETSGTLSSEGGIDLANTTSDPVQCILKDPASSQTYPYTAFPAVRGAVEGLVRYTVWNAVQ